jgi:hypothetical protein
VQDQVPRTARKLNGIGRAAIAVHGSTDGTNRLASGRAARISSSRRVQPRPRDIDCVQAIDQDSRLGTVRGHARVLSSTPAVARRLSGESNRPSLPNGQLGQALDGVNERLAIDVDEAVEGGLLAKAKLVRNLLLPG